MKKTVLTTEGRAHELHIIQKTAKKYVARGYTPEEGGKKLAQLLVRYRVMRFKKMMRQQNPMCGV